MTGITVLGSAPLRDAHDRPVGWGVFYTHEATLEAQVAVRSINANRKQQLDMSVATHCIATIAHVRRAALRASRRLSALLLVTTTLAGPAAAQEREPNDAWRIVVPPQSSLVFARDGSLIGELGREKRTLISLRSLPRYVGQAFVAVEDQRFYQHDGVDVVGIAGALKDAVKGDPRGASTITQQLVGNMHPDLIDRRDMSPLRKLREQSAAREMEKRYTKEQILEAYLNQISFGHGWHGIESAARHYFGKGAAQLTLAEAATLASVPKGPAVYDPIKYVQRVTERRNLVLTLMTQQKYVSSAQAAEAKRVPLKTVPDGGLAVDASYFLDVVRIQAERANVPVTTGGFRIYTSLDPLLQRAANSALVEGIDAVEAMPGYRHTKFAGRPKGNTDYLQGALVAIDPRTGDVRALVGGRNYRESSFDRVIDGVRQPGSAFKPIVYAAAIADSLTANEIIPDTAIAITLDRGRVYRPDNSDNQFLGPITMREALAKSRNVVAVQLAERVGMDTIVSWARRFGIDAPVAPYPASAIGASALQPLDLVGAYTVFANLGSHVDPRFIYRIEDRAGAAVFTNPAAPPRQVIDPKVAFIVRDMMREVVERGTATSVRRYVPANIPVAGKTGTTNDNTDVWFVGMTPEIVAGVWLGFDKPKTITPGAAGGTLAAPIFGKMVADYYATRSPAEWTPPAGLIVAELDRVTGLLADSTTAPDRRYTEYFLAGTEPLPLRVNGWQLFKAGPIIF